MQPTYICGEQHYGLMLGFASFLSLKMLFDAGYKIEPFSYKVDTCGSNDDLVEYVFKTIWGKENVQLDEMDMDGYLMYLYRIRIKGFEKLDSNTLQEIEKQALKVISNIENNSMWGNQLIEAWYSNKDGFEILVYPVNIDIDFTKEVLLFANWIQEILLAKEGSYGDAA